ncbi:hypothetical protein GCM10022377_05020 [Zhihengliuella alba]|uniref:Alpha-1,6-mannosyltransferase n=1 Tax=Zhihengliuella alba TaxID=547018 RepID=A0ABP7CUZ3_9MICC
MAPTLSPEGRSVQVPFPSLTGHLDRLRSRLSRLPVLRRVLGGPEADVHVVLAQGLLASILIMVGSWGVGMLATSQDSLFARAAVLNMLRADPAVVVAASVLLALGLMLLCRAWLRLGQRTMSGSADLTVIRRAVLSWSAPMMLAFPIYSRDVYSYLAQGRLLHQGLNPYENWVSQLPGWYAEGSDSLWSESPSPYGPLFLMIARATYFATGGVPEVGVMVLRLFAAAGVLVCLYAVPRLARDHGVSPSWATWICIANPFFLVAMVGGVHNDTVMIGGTLLAFVLIYRNRRVLGIVAVGLAIAIKPIVVLALPFVGLALLRRPAQSDLPEPGLGRKFRAWIGVGLVAGLTLAAFGAVSGLWFGWISAMATAGTAAFPYAPVGVLGLFVGWVASWFGADSTLVAGVVYSAFRVLSIALTVWWAFRIRASDAVLGCALALSAAALLAPVIQPWYLLWLVPLFAAHRRYGDLLGIAWYVVSMVLVLLVAIEQLSVAQWIEPLPVQITAGLVGVLYLAYIMLVDPKTATLFVPLRASIVDRWTQRGVRAGSTASGRGEAGPPPRE